MTLPQITRDILNIARGANVSQSEKISIRQIEEWVHQYRAILIRRSMDKSNVIPDQWIQELNCQSLELVDKSLCCDITVTTGCKVQRTVATIPNVINTAHLDGLLFVGTIDGKPYQIVSEQRAYYSRYKKWARNDRMAYLRNGHIYITHAIEMQYVSIAGIFENPLDISTYSNGCTGATCFDIDTFEYPVSTDMLPILKEMIFKNEMGTLLQMPSDKHNDDRNTLTPNAVQS